MHINELYNTMYHFNVFPDEKRETAIITESKADDKHLKLHVFDIDSFIKKNPSTKEVYDATFFVRPGVPTSGGLLSREIFGLTERERSGIYGYIDLHQYFIQPLIYKKLVAMDKRFRDIVHGTKRFKLSESGELIEDENGKTGIKFLKDNFDKIKIKDTGSESRKKYTKFIRENKNIMFINKYLVLPAFYRDVNTNETNVGVGEINKLYRDIIVAVRVLKEAPDYGLSMSDAVSGRIQELILAVYDWAAGNNNALTEGEAGLSKKEGLIKKAGMYKTTDRGSRLILSAPELKVEHVDDMMVDVRHSAVPLASVIANYYEFVMFYVKRFFENEFAPGSSYPFVDKNGNESRIYPKDPMGVFSEDEIKEQMKRYIHGYSNRFIPVSLPVEDDKGRTRHVYMRFKGRYDNPDRKIEDNVPGESELINRRLTWCDVFYMAAVEATKDKTILITRYPILRFAKAENI